MDSPAPDSPTLVPHLYEDWDDNEDKAWKAPLEALINNAQTPLQAAQTIDTLLRTATSHRLEALLAIPNSHELSADERQEKELYPPNATAFAEQLLRSYAGVCTAFAPYSAVQNRLIEFLEELRGLPRWMAPETGPNDDGKVFRNEFWKFGFDWIGLEDAFRRECAGGGEHSRWRNLHHIMARITAENLIYCAPFSALQDIAKTALSNQKRSANATRHNNYDVVAAAQWVIWPEECRYVYQECMKKETMDHFWEPWSKDRWALWKREFEDVGKDARYQEQTRGVASKALEKMEEIEKEAGKSN